MNIIAAINITPSIAGLLFIIHTPMHNFSLRKDYLEEADSLLISNFEAQEIKIEDYLGRVQSKRCREVFRMSFNTTQLSKIIQVGPRVVGKQDLMIGKMDSMLEKQDETISEIREVKKGVIENKKMYQWR